MGLFSTVFCGTFMFPWYHGFSTSIFQGVLWYFQWFSMVFSSVFRGIFMGFAWADGFLIGFSMNIFSALVAFSWLFGGFFLGLSVFFSLI